MGIDTYLFEDKDKYVIYIKPDDIQVDSSCPKRWHVSISLIRHYTLPVAVGDQVTLNQVALATVGGSGTDRTVIEMKAIVSRVQHIADVATFDTYANTSTGWVKLHLTLEII